MDSATERPGAPMTPGRTVRALCGGFLMGLANLVPGISGGTMLLATGVYRSFVEAVAEVSTFRFRVRSVALLGVIVVAALVSVLVLAGTIRDLVATHRWAMYSIFIGLTLGGVPLVWRFAQPANKSVALGAVVGFAAMAAMALLTPGGNELGGWPLLVAAGAAGASAMILPGVSGAYLLLILGQYDRILGAVDLLKRGLRGEQDALGNAIQVVAPVAIGVVLGIVVISNLVKHALAKYEKATLGVLLGLLIGSVLGIWPFQTRIKGEPPAYFQPDMKQVALAFGFAIAGYVVTRLVDRLGNRAS